MKAIKIMSIISLVLVVGTLGFAVWSHFSTKKNQEQAKLKYTDVDFEEITA